MRVVSSISMTVSVKDLNSAVSDVTTLGQKRFETSFAAGLIIRFDSTDPKLMDPKTDGFKLKLNSESLSQIH